METRSSVDNPLSFLKMLSGDPNEDGSLTDLSHTLPPSSASQPSGNSPATILDENPFSFRNFLENEPLPSSGSKRLNVKGLAEGGGGNFVSPPPPPPPLPVGVLPHPKLSNSPLSVREDDISLQLLDFDEVLNTSQPSSSHPSLPQSSVDLKIELQRLRDSVALKNQEISRLRKQLTEQERRESQDTEELNRIVKQVEGSLNQANERRIKVETENRRLREELSRLKSRQKSAEGDVTCFGPGSNCTCYCAQANHNLSQQCTLFGRQMELSCLQAEDMLKELLRGAKKMKISAQAMMHTVRLDATEVEDEITK